MISLIVAMGNNRVIGLNNQMPWHLPADLAYFKRITTGHTIVMGRKTFESIGRPLPNRTNVIVTRDRHFEAADCEVTHSIEDVLQRNEDMFVIGGAEIYRQFLPYAKKLYVTHIDHQFDGDTFFPEITAEWVICREETGVRDERNPYDYRFVLYQKETSKS